MKSTSTIPVVLARATRVPLGADGPRRPPHPDRAIRRMHAYEVTWVESVPVRETFKGKLAWDGGVQVFDVKHPKATRAYAWSHATAVRGGARSGAGRGRGQRGACVDRRRRLVGRPLWLGWFVLAVVRRRLADYRNRLRCRWCHA